MTGSPAQSPSPSGSEATLERALDRACGGPAIAGNQLRHLADGPAAFEAMAQGIEMAQSFVHFENYIIRDDATGQRFARLLCAAAKRDVAVRVLYDQFGSRRTPRAYWRRLRRAGVEVRAYNPVNPFRPAHSVRRDHRKYVGADGVRAVLGGLCIGDEWTGDPARRRRPWRDTAVEVVGPAATPIDVSFERLWRAAGGDIPAAQRPPAPVPLSAAPRGCRRRRRARGARS